MFHRDGSISFSEKYDTYENHRNNRLHRKIHPRKIAAYERLVSEGQRQILHEIASECRVQSAVKRVAAGEGREVVLVAGEPGQGKTTLVAEATCAAHEDGMIVLLGRCDEGAGAPYAPFAEAFGHYVAHADQQLLRNHVQAHGAELGRLVPTLRTARGSFATPCDDRP